MQLTHTNFNLNTYNLIILSQEVYNKYGYFNRNGPA